jgi:hypothetical protein
MCGRPSCCSRTSSYRDRSRSLRDLLGGEFRDLLLAPDGHVEALVVERESGRVSTA